MSFLKDIMPIFSNNQIQLIEKYREVGDIYTFIFKMEKQIKWKAGQHGIFTVQNTKINKPTRAFSIASIPAEGQLKISTKISDNPSEFKNVLLNLQPGMPISMRGPIGSFYVQNQKPKLFIAGGIGITPYRAIIKELLLNPLETNKEVQLIYIDSREEFIYKEELDNAGKVSNVKTNYLVKREDSNEKIENFVETYKNEAEYYIVGSKLMINNIENLLISKGIKKKSIRRDRFVGL